MDQILLSGDVTMLGGLHLSLAVSSEHGKKQGYEFMRESIISGFKYLKE